jgi:hypothetical protein
MTKRVLIGYDGSTYADDAIDDLRRAGLPRDVEALVVTVGEAPVVPPHLTVEKAFAGERAVSIVNHARRHTSEALETTRDLADTAARRARLQQHRIRFEQRINATCDECQLFD